jgi:integrase
MAKAWVYQDSKQIRKLGPDKASWYVGYLDPDGKRRCESCGPGAFGKHNAEKLRRKREAELIEGTYRSKIRTTWADFRAEYESKILDGMEPGSRDAARYALNHFERIIKPVRMRALVSKTFADYTADRRKEEGLKPKTLVSAATVNKELRTLRAAVRKAHRWGYLHKLPEFDFLKEAEKLPTYVSPEDFAKLYEACQHAKLPGGLPYPAADWWRGLLIMAYMTGWRIGSLLALRREDVDLEAGTAVSRAQDNKGKRPVLIPLHPVIVEHLLKLPSFSPTVFPWQQNRRQLFVEFGRIQTAAGIKPAGASGKDRYGFHDLRRAFATMNAERLTPDALQTLMQHRDYTTTKRYISIARQLDPAVQNLYVPTLPALQRNLA